MGQGREGNPQQLVGVGTKGGKMGWVGRVKGGKETQGRGVGGGGGGGGGVGVSSQ